MGNKIKKIYVGRDQVRPPVPHVVTETYTLDNTTYNVDVLVAKSGYKIKQIELTTQAYYSGSSDWELARTYIGPDHEIVCNWSQLGGTWGHEYNYGGGPYVGAFTNVSHLTLYKSTNSSATDRNNIATYMKLTPTECEYKVGKSIGNWIETGTNSLSSTIQSEIETAFASNQAKVLRNEWGNPGNNRYTTWNLVITYETI